MKVRAQEFGKLILSSRVGIDTPLPLNKKERTEKNCLCCNRVDIICLLLLQVGVPIPTKFNTYSCVIVQLIAESQLREDIVPILTPIF